MYLPYHLGVIWDVSLRHYNIVLHFRNSKDVQLSKALSWLLRHGAIKEGLKLSPEGYVPLHTVLQHKSFCTHSEADVRRVVANNEKKRFTLRVNPDSEVLEIKANQGHSVDVTDCELIPVLEPKYPNVIHGTYFNCWPKIKANGLSCMTRQHIHLAKGTPDKKHIISGLRHSAEIHIYIDLAKALSDGLKFFESANGVILTRGDDTGHLSPKYFLRAINVHTGFPHYTQPQDLQLAFEDIGPVVVEPLTERSACVVFTSKEHADAALIHNKKLILYGHFLTTRPFAARFHSPKRINKREFVRSKEKDVIIAPSALDLSGDFCTQLDTLLAAVRLTKAEAVALGELYADLEDALSPHMPGCVAMPFGSITTGLGIKTSDADCFVMAPGAAGAAGAVPGANPAQMVNRAKRILQAHPQKFAEILPIPRANTPIVKFFHVPTGTNCDLSFKTPLGSQNSRLIAFLLQADPRLIPMAVAIKYWAKVHDLSGTGKMTNYALTMLIIFYLQQIAILPPICSLQQHRQYDCIVDSWNTGFNDTPLPPSTNTASISELIGGFYDYFNKFNFNDLVVCPYLGTAIKKDLFRDLNLLPSEFDLYKQNVLNESVMPVRITTAMCIQDPFEQSHNVASSISPRKADDIKAFFKLAADTYEKEKQSECKEFLKIILLQKPKSVKARLNPEYKVNLTSRILSAIVSEDWVAVVREIVLTIFERLLKIKLTKVEKQKGSLSLPKREKEKYTANVTRAIWKRKQLTKLYSLMNLDFTRQQERITEEILSIEKTVFSLPFMLTLSFTHNKNVIVSIKLQEGDPETFKEFGKFFITIMQKWFLSLLKLYTKHPEREMAIMLSNTSADNNLVPNDLTIDKMSLEGDNSPQSEAGSPNGEDISANHKEDVTKTNLVTIENVVKKDIDKNKTVATVKVVNKNAAAEKEVILNNLVVSETDEAVNKNVVENDIATEKDILLNEEFISNKDEDLNKNVILEKDTILKKNVVAENYVTTEKNLELNENVAAKKVVTTEIGAILNKDAVTENEVVLNENVVADKDVVLNKDAVA